MAAAALAALAYRSFSTAPYTARYQARRANLAQMRAERPTRDIEPVVKAEFEPTT